MNRQAFSPLALSYGMIQSPVSMEHSPQQPPVGHKASPQMDNCRCIYLSQSPRREVDTEVLSLLASKLDPQQVVLAGVHEIDPDEQVFITSQNICCVTAPQLNRAPSAVGDIFVSKEATTIYIHLDLDVLEPVESVGCPRRGGMRAERVLGILGDLAERLEVVGSGVAEYLPAAKADHWIVERVLSCWLSLR
jgi:arginase family enzyme